MNSVILIPSLNPDDKMVDYVCRLSDAGFDKIIVVNDGSTGEYDSFFERAGENGRCIVLTHEVNKGKGAALKTGMKYYLEHFMGCDGMVTGDADGQHSLEDTIKLAKRLENEQDKLILGSRDFSQSNVPPRSRFGNRTTSLVFKLTHGKWLSDTQTGLRAIPEPLIKLFSEIAGERYEYEMNMLIECADRGIPMAEETIQTIYLDENSGSHYHAIRDSFRIYSLILGSVFKYLLSGFVCFLFDLLLFTLFDRFLLPGALKALESALPAAVWLTISTFASAAVARVCSSLLNFTINKKLVFHKKGGTAKSMVKYIALVVIIYFTSSTLVSVLRSIFPAADATLIKMCIDAILVIVSYTLQRAWVFSDKKTSGK